MENFTGVTPHRPLSQDELRYVELLPAASRSDPVICTLVYSQPLKDSSYETLSYAWGESSETETITLNEQQFPVTVNLFDALTYLRLPDKTRLLWIDAICINQGDKDERGSLVQRMREIYQSSGATIAWLGAPGDLGQDEVDEAFATAIEMAELYDSSQGRRELRTEEWPNSHIVGLQHLSVIARRRWFERVWVIQEVDYESAERRIEVQCGSARMPFMEFCGACKAAYFFTRRRFRAINNCPAVNIAVSHDSRRFMERLETERPGSFSPGVAFAFILAAGAKARSTDVRDKIYGLYGLLPSSTIALLPSHLKPDYKKPAHAVFLDYAAYIIRTCGFIDGMYYTSGRPIPVKGGGPACPSWAPRWDFNPSRFYVNQRMMSVYLQLLRHFQPATMSEDMGGPHIVTQGIRMGTVLSVFEGFTEDWVAFKTWDLYRKYQVVRDHLCAFDVVRRNLYGDGPREQLSTDSLMRLIMHNTDDDSFCSRLEMNLNLIIMSSSPGPETLKTTQQLVEHVFVRFYDRNIMLVDDGSVNICVQELFDAKSQIGDCLFVLKGSLHQYLLRPVGNYQDRKWQRINSTYVRPDVLQDFWQRGLEVGAGEVERLVEYWEQNKHLVERVVII